MQVFLCLPSSTSSFIFFLLKKIYIKLSRITPWSPVPGLSPWLPYGTYVIGPRFQRPRNGYASWLCRVSLSAQILRQLKDLTHRRARAHSALNLPTKTMCLLSSLCGVRHFPSTPELENREQRKIFSVTQSLRRVTRNSIGSEFDYQQQNSSSYLPPIRPIITLHNQKIKRRKNF